MNSHNTAQQAQDEPDEWTFEVQRMVAQHAQITVLATNEADAWKALELAKAAPDTPWHNSSDAVFYRQATLVTSEAPTEEDGWFDVKAYKTKDDYLGFNPEIVDGFLHEHEAMHEAQHRFYDDYYQVVIVAYGEHLNYESGEPMYTRFQRD